MKTNLSIFAQIIRLIPRDIIHLNVEKHNSDYNSKGINTWTHLVSMLYCQFGNFQSIRDISFGLRSATGNLNHLGVTRAPSKSAISYINAHRGWTFFRDVYFSLFKEFKVKVNRIKLNRKLFILDSTLIPLCISLFDWAYYRKKKGAIKIHTVLDYDSCLPVFIRMTDGKTSDIEIAEKISFPKGSILTIDRGYLDFNFLRDLDSTGVFFVIRAKDNTVFDIVKTLILPEKSENIISDDHIVLIGQQTKNKYKKRLRLVQVADPETGEIIPLLTNNFFWSPKTISELYKNRWEIETFFRTVKQNLKIKSFIGTSENAVLTQIWTALITILLLTVLKSKALYKWHMSNMVGFIRLNLFVKIDLFEWLNHPFLKDKAPPGQIQLDLF
jgi:Transposase DDE domain/Domain of unknown function (DUF4372)